MPGRRNYGKRMGGHWKSYGAIKSRLKQADTKLSTAHRTILQEGKAIKESPGEYDPGSDLQTEADRIKSARADIDEALRMIKADCAQGGNAATKIRGIPVSKLMQKSKTVNLDDLREYARKNLPGSAFELAICAGPNQITEAEFSSRLPIWFKLLKEEK